MTQQDLFEVAQPGEPDPDRSRTDPAKCEFGFCGVAAYRKLPNPPETFQFSEWRKVIGGHQLVGSTTRVITKGKDKGRLKWYGEKTIVIVNDAEVKAEEARFEADGHCAKCLGRGQRWAGWSKDTGNKYKPCERCGQTGKVNV